MRPCFCCSNFSRSLLYESRERSKTSSRSVIRDCSSESQNGKLDVPLPYSMSTPPLEARTINWGIRRGQASPLVANGVQTPLANDIDC
jgi:hypothetical protein